MSTRVLVACSPVGFLTLLTAAPFPMRTYRENNSDLVRNLGALRSFKFQTKSGLEISGGSKCRSYLPMYVCVNTTHTFAEVSTPHSPCLVHSAAAK